MIWMTMSLQVHGMFEIISKAFRRFIEVDVPFLGVWENP